MQPQLPKGNQKSSRELVKQEIGQFMAKSEHFEENHFVGKYMRNF